MEKEGWERLRQLIINNGLKWDEGLFKDGQATKWIFDLREVVLTPEGSRLASSLIYEEIKDLDFDAVGGPSIAAEPLTASLIMHFYNKGREVRGFIVRKQPNNFGLRKKIEGLVRRGDKVVLIDDAINAGNSKFDAIEALNKEGLQVVKIITLVDFCKSGHAKLKEEGYDLDYIFTLEDFGLELNKVYNYGKLNTLTEFKSAKEKENIVKKINQILEDEITDFKLHGNSILVAFKEGAVFCFNQESYSTIWSLELGESISTPLFIDGDMVIVSASSGLKRSILFFISIMDGVILKTVGMKGNVNSVPVPYDNLYLVGSDDGKLYGIDKKSKNIAWNFQTKGPIKISPPADQTKGTIYLSSTDRNIYALNPDGRLLWKKHLGNIKSVPLLNQNNIILNSDINVIFCLNQDTGKLAWFHELKNEAFCINIISNKVAIGCAQGHLLFLDTDNGKVLDCFKVSNEDIREIAEYKNKISIILKDGKNYII